MHHPTYSAALAEARAAPELWRLGLGVRLCVFIYLSSAVFIAAIAAGLVAAEQGPFAVMPFLSGLATPDTPGKVLFVLATFFGMALGPVLAAAALHGRGPGSLMGDGRDWLRGFAAGVLAVLLIYGALMALAFRFDPPLPGLPLSRWLLLLPLALPLLFLQIAAEELLFRGYLQQQLAARFAARAIWFWGPAVIFAALHAGPQAGANLPIVLLGALTFGLVAADLAERTGSLGAAMGLHFANNFFGLFVLATQGTITGLALHVTAAPAAQTGWQSLSMAASIPVLLLAWALTRRLLRV